MVRERQTKLAVMLLLIVAGAGTALWVASVTEDAELKKALLSASLTLVFGALLGGFAKLLLDDFDRGRQQRAEQVQFLLTCFADLKSVYDRAERTRVLLPAHQSAATLGNEMRDLIDARTRLFNVVRAVKMNHMLEETQRNSVTASVDEMSDYLNSLIGDFQSNFKEVSELQRKYEVAIKAHVEKAAADPLSAAATTPKNEPWERIKSLSTVKDLLDFEIDEKSQTRYQDKFLCGLDKASKLLTNELQKVLG